MEKAFVPALAVLALIMVGGSASAQEGAAGVSTRHPAGVTFLRPANWKVEEKDGNLVLLPPNPNPLGAPPSYLLAVTPRGGITRPDDPEMIAGLVKRGRESRPYLERVGGVETVPMDAGKGAVLAFEGKSPEGLLERGLIFTGIVGDRLVFLFARSSRIVLVQHEPALVALFRTVRGEPVASPFAGVFRNERLTLTLEPDGAGFKGRIEFGERTFPVEARADGEKLTGKFESEGSEFAFTATLAAGNLTLVTGGTTYSLARVGAPAPQANPLAGAPAGPTPAAPAAPPRARFDLGPVQPDPKREWTVVVYLDGDNDLESFAVRDLVEMEFGLPPRGVEVIVLIDRAKGFETTAGDWTDARVYRVLADRDPTRIASKVLASPGEVNMGDPAVLGDFLGAALETFPARHRMLILWDHGGGWASMVSDIDAPGAPDGHDSLTLPELREGIRSGLKAAGVEKLDIVGFDMCLMAQLETAVELEGLADVMVSSQAIEPGNGWPYNQILPQIGKGTLGARRIGQEIVRCYSRFYDAKQARIATLSALDLRVLPEVVRSFDGLIRKLMPCVAKEWPSMSRSIFYAEAYAERTDIRRGPKALASVDLLDVVKRLRYSTKGFSAEEEYRKLVEAMDRFVLASHTSPRRRLSNGLSIYAPVHGVLLDPEYSKTRLSGACEWPKLLAAVHAAQKKNATTPRFSDMRITDDKGKPIPAVEAQMNHRLSFTLTGNNIIWTQVWFGRDDPDVEGMLVLYKGFVVDPLFYKRRTEAVADVVDLIMPEYEDGRNELYQDLNGLALRVTDGKKAFQATIDASTLDDPEHYRVPALLSHPSTGDVEATILFDASWWQVKSVIAAIPQPDGRVMYRQIEPPPETRVTLLLETVRATGETQYRRGGSFAWGDGPELLLDTEAPGTYRAAFIAETIGGESAVETISFPVKESGWLGRLKGGDLGKFDASTLVGTWDHYLIGERYTPTGLVFEIKPHPKSKGLLVADVTSTKRADIKINQVLWLDTRLLPCIRFFEYDEKGEQIGFYLGTCGYGIREGKATFFYKMADVTRLSAALVKRVDAGAAAPTPGAGSGTGSTPPRPASIVGRWADDAGTVLVCNASNYQLLSYGEVLDAGRYVIRGKQLLIESSDGERETYTYSIAGNRLTLIDSEGVSLVFRKAR